MSISAKEGEELPIGALLAVIDTDKQGTGSNTSTEQGKVTKETEKEKEAAKEKEKETAKVEKKQEREKPIEQSGQVKQTGQIPVQVQAKAKVGEVAHSVGVVSREQERQPMSRLRQTVARRLKESQNTYASLTTFNEIDMTAASNLRNKYKEEFEKKHGIKLGFMSFFLKAATQALLEFPAVNAHIDGTDIVNRKFIDISVAVSAPTGLVVPVLRNCENMGFADFEKNVAGFGKKARDGKLTVEDMTGGTFTISNGGVFGSMMGTPIINPPQSAVLGMHGIFQRPIAVDGKVEIRPMMYVALTYDHRIIDGREAVLFLRKIKDVVEDPARTLLQL